MDRRPHNNRKVNIFFDRRTPFSSQSSFPFVLRFRNNAGAFLLAGKGKFEGNDISGVNIVPVNDLFSENCGIAVSVHLPAIKPVRRRGEHVSFSLRLVDDVAVPLKLVHIFPYGCPRHLEFF